jgi:phosphoribosylamine--glycine ligase
LNTGGMGAISPVPFADAAFMDKVVRKIIEPTVAGLEKEGLDYKGFIFAGLIKVDDEPFVIEYNCRMGDPETEVVIPRIRTDLVQLLKAAAQGRLEDQTVDIDPRYATTIFAVSGGYPNDFEKGFPISGLDIKIKDSMAFQAGTRAEGNTIVTNGGRVFCATSLAADLDDALYQSRDLVEQIEFENKYFRKDIGYEFIQTLSGSEEE